jgi:hypothetical protein
MLARDLHRAFRSVSVESHAYLRRLGSGTSQKQSPLRSNERATGPLGLVCSVSAGSSSTVVLMRVLTSLFAAVLLTAACHRPETPQWAPNVERTDITPSEWMVGCFVVDPMTDRLRAAGAREYELTARLVKVADGRHWYRVQLNGSHEKYGMWTPVAASKLRIYAGSNGFGNLSYAISPSNDRLVGTYQEATDVSPGSAPEVPVSLRRVPCVSAPPR